eukprot:5167144-Amphidinium_carterae.1
MHLPALVGCLLLLENQGHSVLPSSQKLVANDHDHQDKHKQSSGHAAMLGVMRMLERAESTSGVPAAADRVCALADKSCSQRRTRPTPLGNSLSLQWSSCARAPQLQTLQLAAPPRNVLPH